MKIRGFFNLEAPPPEESSRGSLQLPKVRRGWVRWVGLTMGQEKNGFWCVFFSQKEMGVEIIYIYIFNLYIYSISIIHTWKRNGIYSVYIYYRYLIDHIISVIFVIQMGEPCSPKQQHVGTGSRHRCTTYVLARRVKAMCRPEHGDPRWRQLPWTYPRRLPHQPGIQFE